MVVTAVWGTKVVRRLLPSFHSRARADEAAFHIALLLLFALSALALYAGMAAIVGRFSRAWRLPATPTGTSATLRAV